MFELSMVDVTAANREREVAAALRRRQILQASEEASTPVRAHPAPTSEPRRAAARVRAVER
jgi:hypothetical protein